MWIQPNDKFWEHLGIPPSQVPLLVHGLWLKFTGTGSNSLVCRDRAAMQREQAGVRARPPRLSGLVKGKTIKISGHRALQLRNGTGSESIYVSISSKPEILRIGDDGTLNFSGVRRARHAHPAAGQRRDHLARHVRTARARCSTCSGTSSSPQRVKHRS